MTARLDLQFSTFLRGRQHTYLPAYLDRQLASDDPEFRGRFAAAAATLALERKGAFRAGAPEVHSRMRAADSVSRP